MEENIQLYSKIKSFVEADAQKIATQVYTDRATQFSVAQTPTHFHNGLDSLPIEQKYITPNNTYYTTLSVDDNETFTLPTPAGATQLFFNGFAANNDITSLTFNGNFPDGATSTTAGLLAGNTTATLSVSFTGTTGSYSVTFSNGDIRTATLTHGSTGMSWIGGLTTNATSTFTLNGAFSGTLTGNWTQATTTRKLTFSDGETRLGVLTNGSALVNWAADPNGSLGGVSTSSVTASASLRAICNGIVQVGRAYKLTGTNNSITINSDYNIGEAFSQISNSMYVDSNDLTKNRVNTSSTDLLLVQDDTSTVVSRLTVNSFNNNTVSITSIVVGGWKIQGALIIT